MSSTTPAARLRAVQADCRRRSACATSSADFDALLNVQDEMKFCRCELKRQRIDAASFWLFMVIASGMAAFLGFQLAATTLPAPSIVFAIVSSWSGVHFGLTHVYASFRRAQQVVREVQR